jgi:hypothetical protein
MTNKFDKFWKANLIATEQPSGNTLTDAIKERFGYWGSFEIDNADAILVVSKLEHVNPALVALTWMNETTFRFYSEPNMNGAPDNFTKWDVGPMQLNVGWLLKNIQVKYLNPVGLDVLKVTGGKSNLFDGDPMENLRMGARMLVRIGKTDEERAVIYTGPNARPNRLKSFHQFFPMFTTFFEEYTK